MNPTHTIATAISDPTKLIGVPLVIFRLAATFALAMFRQAADFATTIFEVML